MDHTTFQNAPTKLHSETEMVQAAISEWAQMSERVPETEPRVEADSVCWTGFLARW